MKNNRCNIAIYASGFLILLAIWVVVSADKFTVINLFRFTMLILLSYIAMIIDIKTKQIPNILVLIMIIAWLLLVVPVMFYDTGYGINMLLNSLLGLLAGGGIFLLVYIISRRGLGGGDVKFMAAAGLFLGFPETIPAIFYGTVFAAVTGLILILIKKLNRKETMPLVPFLFIGIMITAIIG